MRNINRTFYVSKCYGHKYNESTCELEDFDFEVYGNYTAKRATNYARKKFKDNTMLVLYVELEKHYVTMSFEDFIKYGREVY